ncbi:MAG: hypothetical protein EOO13_06625 [Chitinophagaceae bacterium]|nr:MAG: hypothetical protein EOO13_06625 [Chitinophagaceae bacterium]
MWTTTSFEGLAPVVDQHQKKMLSRVGRVLKHIQCRWLEARRRQAEMMSLRKMQYFPLQFLNPVDPIKTHGSGLLCLMCGRQHHLKDLPGRRPTSKKMFSRVGRVLKHI